MAGHLEDARAKVAALINADPQEVVFTSGGTESINTVLHSALLVAPGKRHLVTTAVEHSATIQCSECLRQQGYEVTFLPVEPDGSLNLDLLARSIRSDTALVSVMWANNETGVVFPIAQIAELCHRRGTLLHTDAVQALGKTRIDVQAAGVDFLSLSAHKFHAPKGIGLLYIKRRTPYKPYLLGGHQEQGRRAGTENVPYIVGFGRAAEMAMSKLSEMSTRVRSLRDRMELSIVEAIPYTHLNGNREQRLPNTSNLGFEGVEAESILMLLDQLGICASTGSACTTGSLEPSHVLTAMGVSSELARGSLRFSLGIYNTDENVDYLLQHLPLIITNLRTMSPSHTAT